MILKVSFTCLLACFRLNLSASELIFLSDEAPRGLIEVCLFQQKAQNHLVSDFFKYKSLTGFLTTVHACCMESCKVNKTPN